MVMKFAQIINKMSLDLGSVEEDYFTKQDIDKSDFSLVWWSNLCSFIRLRTFVLEMTEDEYKQYDEVVKRFRMAKDKIVALGLEYPDFIDL